MNIVKAKVWSLMDFDWTDRRLDVVVKCIRKYFYASGEDVLINFIANPYTKD